MNRWRLPQLLATRVAAILVSASILAATAPATRAQDLYDPTLLRTFALTFHDANWLELLEENYEFQTYILADLQVDGGFYPSVGVRIRGNTSYTSLPEGSQKFSLNVDVDYTFTTQTVMGYDSLNLNNGFRDPTFCREVVYNNYVAQFIPNPRANHVVVTLNGENWGVYNNVQQFDKTMLAPHFADPDGLRIKCPNRPAGPGLRYEGPDPADYELYEIKNDGGLADPWQALIDVCFAVTNGATDEEIDALFAIDPSSWSVALENMLTDDDSYVRKGADFVTYRNPVDGRTVLLQTDANETFTRVDWSPTLNFGSNTKPVLSHVLDAGEPRRRYMAHYRTVMENLDWSYFGPIFTAHRNLIDAAVQADPKKLYSYTLFQDNFASTVEMPYGGQAGGTVIGLEEFVQQRAAYLAARNELAGDPPTIGSVAVSDDTPSPGDAVIVTATVTPGASAVDRVTLYYRQSPSGTYDSIDLVEGGGGTWSVQLPIAGVGGQVVAYYVGATSSDSDLSMVFHPQGTEWTPLILEYGPDGAPGMRITEWMYSGSTGEFFELTNLSAAPIDLSGYSFDDSHAVPGAFDLSAFGVVQPGRSVIVTQSPEVTFRSDWALGPEVPVIGNLGATSGNNLGRNDTIHLYDAAAVLIDRLTYGDEDLPGTIRTQGRSGRACCAAIGQDDVAAWELSAVGDGFGSWVSSSNDVGSPGAYNVWACGGCAPIIAVADAAAPPRGLRLASPTPNPFAATTEIRFGLEQAERVRVAVFDVAGREVQELVDGAFAAGDHVLVWDGRDGRGRPVAAGIYFVRVTSERGWMTRKLVRVE